MWIAIEGCIGAGKTTVAGLLAGMRGSSAILERYTDNPFLAKFYSEPSRYALETELSFVLIHFHQVLHALRLAETAEHISDFHISKDHVYAEMNLHGDDLRVFENLYTSLSQRLPPPDVMVCLQCSDRLLLRRIEKRQRSVEMGFSSQYVRALNRLYDDYFRTIPWPKVLVNGDEHDFVDDPSSVAWLSREIDKRMRA